MGKISNWFKGIGTKISNLAKKFSSRFNDSRKTGSIFRIKTLTQIQIQNKRKLSIQKTTKQKILFALLYLVIIAALCVGANYLILVFNSYVLLKSIPPVGQDPIFFNYLIFALGIYLIASVLSLSIGLISNLYKAQDNAMLLVYPVKPGEIFVSKLLVVYLREFKKALFVIIPFLVGFYIQKHVYYGLDYTYFFGAFFVFLFIPIFLCVLSGVLSLLFSFIDSFFKRFPIGKFVFAIVLVVGVFAFILWALSLLPNNLKLMDLWTKIVDNVTAFVGAVDNYLIISKSIGTILRCRGTWEIAVAVLILLAVIAVCFILIVFVCYRYFFKAEGKAKEISSNRKRKTKDVQTSNVFLAFFRKELKLFLRSEDGFMSTIIFIIVLPLLIFTLNKIFGVMYLSEMGKKIVFSVNVLLCITVLTASNITCANALSREGSQFYLLKISPINTKYVCYAKILIHLILNVIAFIVVGLCLKFSSSSGTITKDIFTNFDIVMIILVSFFVTTGHLLWTFELDLTHPKVQLYMSGEKDTSNLTKSLFIGLGLAVLFTVLMILFLFVFPETGLSFKGSMKWISILIFALLFLVARIILFVKRLSVKFEDITY